jgi:hypothetical protein
MSLGRDLETFAACITWASVQVTPSQIFGVLWLFLHPRLLVGLLPLLHFNLYYTWPALCNRFADTDLPKI